MVMNSMHSNWSTVGFADTSAAGCCRVAEVLFAFVVPRYPQMNEKMEKRREKKNNLMINIGFVGLWNKRCLLYLY